MTETFILIQNHERAVGVAESCIFFLLRRHSGKFSGLSEMKGENNLKTLPPTDNSFFRSMTINCGERERERVRERERERERESGRGSEYRLEGFSERSPRPPRSRLRDGRRSRLLSSCLQFKKISPPSFGPEEEASTRACQKAH